MRALLPIGLLLVSIGCRHDHEGHSEEDHSGHGHDTPGAAAAAPKVTNRVPVPATVQRNLGITFVKAEERAVSETLRLAGHFDLPPSARMPAHTPLAGIVTVHVKPLERVEKGHLLSSVSSPELLEHRHALHLSSDGVGVATDALAIAGARVTEVQAALAYSRKRNARLRAAGATKADLQAQQAELKRRLVVLKAEQKARRHEVTRARHRFDAELLSFSTQIGIPLDTLRETGPIDPDHGEAKPQWEVIDRLELRAHDGGLVSEVAASSGAWLGAGDKVVELRKEGTLWLVARALNTDLSTLKNGQRVRLLATGDVGAGPGKSVGGTLQVGLTGDTGQQTIPVYVTLDETPEWARAGVAATVEVTTRGGKQREVAIPVGALVRDGLSDVFFRRDPADPEQVIRVEADRGPSDGEWVAVYNGVAPGDEVVVDGAYELKLASSRKPTETGHFHADGSFHAEED